MPAYYLKFGSEQLSLLQRVVRQHAHETSRLSKLYSAVTNKAVERDGPALVITESQLLLLRNTAHRLNSVAYEMQNNVIPPGTAARHALRNVEYLIEVIQGTGRKSYQSPLFKIRRALRAIHDALPITTTQPQTQSQLPRREAQNVRSPDQNEAAMSALQSNYSLSEQRIASIPRRTGP